MMIILFSRGLKTKSHLKIETKLFLKAYRNDTSNCDNTAACIDLSLILLQASSLFAAHHLGKHYI